MLSLLLGVALGVGSAWVVLSGQILRGAETHVGVWSTSVERGSSDANAYVRGTTAIQALLAMRSDQAVYYAAFTDEEGRELDPRCTYEIAGGALPAAWWSVTVYDGAYLVRNDDVAPSVDATRVGEGTRWSAQLAPTRADAEHWLSSRDADRPNLLLRLYEPAQSVLDDPASITAPTVRRLSCEEAS